MRRTLGLAVAVVFGLATLGRAAPLDVNQVSADAKWAVHLDIDALHASTLFQKARQKMLEKHPEAEAGLAMVRSIWKFDPCTDLHGVTIYGSQLKKDTGAAIVHAKVDQQLLLDKAKLAPEHRVSTYGKYELHSWLHAKGSRHQRSMAGAFYKPDVMVFGGSAEEVMAALDVLDGTKPSFAGKQPPLGSEIPPGAILVAGAIGLGDAKLPCKSPVAKQAESLVLCVGENQGKVFVQGTLAVKQAAVAQQIKTVADGALALALLAHGDDANVLKIISAVKVTAAEKAVSVEGAAPVDEVWDHLQKAAAKGPWNKGGHGFGKPPFPYHKEKK